MAGLLDDVLKNLDSLKSEVEQLEAKGEPTMADDKIAAIFEEHNSKTPHADVQDQCQCKDCKAFRNRAANAQA